MKVQSFVKVDSCVTSFMPTPRTTKATLNLKLIRDRLPLTYYPIKILKTKLSADKRSNY